MDNLLAMAFQANPLMTLLYSLESKEIIATSDSFADMCCDRAKTLAGKKLSELPIWTDPLTPERLSKEIERKGKVSGIEALCWSPKGATWLARISGSTLGKPRASHAVLTFEEVTTIRNTDSNRQEDAEHFHPMPGPTPAIVLFKNGQDEWLEANEFSLNLLGLAGVDYRGKSNTELAQVSPTCRDFFLTCEELDERAWQTKEPTWAELTIPQPSSQTKVFDLIWVPLFKVDGSRKELFVAGHDITERRQKEESLKRADSKYRHLYESMMDAFATVDMNGRLIEYNEAYRQMLGYEREELDSLTYMDVTPEKWHAKEAEIIQTQVMKRGYSEIYEKEYRRKDGKIIPVELRTVLLGDEAGHPACMWGIARDLSKRKQAEAALRESEERFRMLFEKAPEAIVVYDIDQARFTDANASAAKLFGCSIAQLLDQGLFVLYAPSQPDKRSIAESFEEHCRRAMAGETVVFERSIHTADGRDIICEVRMTQFPSPDHRLLRGTYIDITEQKEAKKALVESERRLAAIMANLPGIAYRCHNDQDWTMEFISEGCLELTGYPAEDIITNAKMSYHDIIHPNDRDAVRAEIQTAIREKRPFRLSYRIHTVKGELRWVMEQGRPVLNDQGEPVALEGFITDITEQKHTEVALRDSEEHLKLKLDSILLPEADISDQDLRNMLNTPAIQTLMDHIYELTNMAIAVLDVKGNILVAAGWREICTLFHRVHPLSNQNCIESDLFLSNNIRPGECVEYKCKNNLWDVVTPLYIGDKHAANIYMGQFFYDDEEVNEQLFVEQAKKFGFNQEQYLAALHRVPRFSRPHVRFLMDFIVKFAELVSKLSLSNLRLAKVMVEQSHYSEALRQSEYQTHQIIEKIPISISITDLTDKVIYLNQRFTQAFGYTLDDIPTLEQWWQRAYPEENYRREVMETWQQVTAIADKTGTDIEPRDYQVTRKDGMVRQVRIFGTRISDKNLVILDDITDRKQWEETLQKSQLMLQNVIENFPGVVFWKDCHSVYLGCNKAFALGAGLAAPEEIVGKTDYDLPWAEYEAASYQADDQDVMQNGNPKYGIVETQNQANGRVAWFETSKVPLVNSMGQVVGCLGISNDITARKMAENQLIEESRRKDEFLAMLSHELRNPLAPIRNAVAVMRLASGNEEMLKRQQTVIERQVKQLARLFDDLLDVACITRGRIGIQKERVELQDVVNRAIETTMILSGDRKDDFSCTITDQKIMLEGDQTRLVQVVCNLLNNAVKYSEPGQAISLSVFPAPPKDAAHRQEAVIRVEDQGIGIAPDLLPKIFDLFIQADKTLDRARGGLGIGLTLTRRIVELHGGHIEASSPGLGKGSQFSVWLPVEIESGTEPSEGIPETSEPAEHEDESQGRQHKVLVVDDNVDEVKSMQDLLGLWGFTVDAAFDGNQAIDQYTAFQPGIVLLDIGLPGLNGNEVARAIRASAGDSPPLLIAVTGYGREEDRRQSTQAGFDVHLTKPIDLAQLHELLNDYIKKEG